MAKQTSQEITEELRNYKPDGDFAVRYWVDKDDKWWDIGFYFHIFVLIGFWMLYDALTTHYITKAQFSLNHTITFFWAIGAGIYTFWAVIHDIIENLKEAKEAKEAE